MGLEIQSLPLKIKPSLLISDHFQTFASKKCFYRKKSKNREVSKEVSSQNLDMLYASKNDFRNISKFKDLSER